MQGNNFSLIILTQNSEMNTPLPSPSQQSNWPELVLVRLLGHFIFSCLMITILNDKLWPGFYPQFVQLTVLLGGFVVVMSDVARQPAVNGTKSKPAASETRID